MMLNKKNVMKVYRIENQDSGKGPYMAKHEIDISMVRKIEQMHEVHNSYRKIFPGFYTDFSCDEIIKITGYRTHEVETLFGFTSIKQLESWFNVYIKDLLESGLFVIKEYNVDESKVFISTSKKQCVFIINRKVEGMGKVVNFEVTESMQLLYITIYETMLDRYLNN